MTSPCRYQCPASAGYATYFKEEVPLTTLLARALVAMLIQQISNISPLQLIFALCLILLDQMLEEIVLLNR